MYLYGVNYKTYLNEMKLTLVVYTSNVRSRNA